MNPQPFTRARAMMAMLAAAMAMPLAQQQAALLDIGPYVSRGKGGKRPSRSVGTKACQRAAAKRRNVARNRRAHRG